MQNNFDFPQMCPNCQGYKTIPYSWNSTVPPKLCSCPKVSLSWECHRCGKINAPWKGSCDCTPSPSSSGPTCSGRQPYDAGPVHFNHYFPDTKGPTTINYDSLNKNFTDK